MISAGTSISALGLAITVSVVAVMYTQDEARAAPATAVVRVQPLYHSTLNFDEAGQPYADYLTVDGELTPSLLLTTVDAAHSALLAEDAGGSPTTPTELLAGSLPGDDRQTLHAFGLSQGPAPLPPVSQEAPAPEPAPAAEPAPALPLEPTAIPAALPLAPAAPLDVPLVHAGMRVLQRYILVNLTFYDCAGQGFCGAMASGRRVYHGAAACSYNLPLGTRFYIHGDPTGRIYRCEDRGILPNTWVDIFWFYPADGWKWQAAVGRTGTIDVVEWGTGR